MHASRPSKVCKTHEGTSNNQRTRMSRISLEKVPKCTPNLFEKRYQKSLSVDWECTWKACKQGIEIYPKWCLIWIRLEGRGGQSKGRSKKCLRTYFFISKWRFWAPAGHPQKSGSRPKATRVYLPGAAQGHPKLPKCCVLCSYWKNFNNHNTNHNNNDEWQLHFCLVARNEWKTTKNFDPNVIYYWYKWTEP